MELIDEAVAAGARRERACEELGVSVRTVQRWSHCAQDGRPGAVRAAPSNKLSDAEREHADVYECVWRDDELDDGRDERPGGRQW